MSDLGVIALTALQASIPSASCVLRVADGTEFAVLCPTVGLSRNASEIGLSFGSSINARFDSTLDPDGKMITNEQVTLIKDGTEYKLRINDRVLTCGMTRLTLEAVNG